MQHAVPVIDKKAIGSLGERKAQNYILLRQGYKIMANNVRMRGGEIDIVAKDGETIVFIEVKYRAGDRFGSPFDAVSDDKIYRITKAAVQFLKQRKLTEKPIRFDVIGITPDKTEHIKNAFEPELELVC